MKKINVGVQGMDKMLGGGLPAGRTILVSGSCGTGKTIFATQFAAQGALEGEPCVYVSFEQSKDKLIEDTKQIGMDLGYLEKKGKFKLIGGPVGHIKYFKEKTKADLFDISNEIREVVHEIGAKRVVLDSVNLFLMLFDNDLERRKALAELTAMLDKLDCTTIMTCEVKEGTKDISWYGFEDFVADGVIVLYRIPFESMYERGISVIKMRGVNHMHSVSAMQIRGEGMKVFPDKEPFHKVKQ